MPPRIAADATNNRGVAPRQAGTRRPTQRSPAPPVARWPRSPISGTAARCTFTLLGHDALERLLHREGVHRLLQGESAGVVGLMAGTAIALFKASVGDLEALVLFALALGVLFAWKGRMAIPALILAAAAWGWS